jgi:hypothetical protein
MKNPIAYLFCSLLAASLGAAESVPSTSVRAMALASQIYEVQQKVVLSEVPKGTRSVHWWISIPDDDAAQRVLDFSVASAPGTWRLFREPDHGNRFLLVEVVDPAAEHPDMLPAPLAAALEMSRQR